MSTSKMRLLAAAAGAALALVGCRGDANFAENGNAERDQAPTTAGPPVTGKKVATPPAGTGGSGEAKDCPDPSQTCPDPAAPEAQPGR